MLLTITMGHAALAGDDKKKADEAPKEQSVVDYDSKTHGAVQVKSVGDKPGDWFTVLRDGKRAFKGNPPRLNNTLELAPGAYVVEVNRTQRKVDIEAGKKRILWTGELIVESNRKGNSWIPKQGKETKLAANPPVVNSSVALFAGTYTVYLNLGVGGLKNLGEAEVKPGKKTAVKD
jgi:hypothetical protein